MKFDLWNRFLHMFNPMFHSLAPPSYDSVAKHWNVPAEEQSGEVSRTVKNSDLKGMHIWVARPSEPREKELLDILNETCLEMGIKKVPKLLIYANYIPNAASEGHTSEIMFSTDLLENMSLPEPDPKTGKLLMHNEVKAVMGHELDHHKHLFRDLVFKLANIVFFVGMFAALKSFIDKHLDTYKIINKSSPPTAKQRSWPLNRLLDGSIVTKEQKPQPLRAILGTSNFILSVTNFIGTIIIGLGLVQNWYQRWAESRADAAGAKVAGTQAMVNALRILERRSGEIAEDKINWGEMPKPDDLKTRDLDHDRTSDRIKKLLENAPKGYVDKKSEETQKDPQLVLAK